jgi:hypothetical protein
VLKGVLKRMGKLPAGGKQVASTTQAAFLVLIVSSSRAFVDLFARFSGHPTVKRTL